MRDFLILSTLMISATQAWLMSKYDTPSTFTSPWNIDCSRTGEGCIHSSQCCGDEDVCLADMKSSSLGHCRDMGKYRILDIQQKYEGEICETSAECLDLCCRVVPRHRNSPIHVCGSKKGFMCI